MDGRIRMQRSTLTRPWYSMNSKLRFLVLIPLTLGIIALSTQIIILREFLSLYNGNELVPGIVLSGWMLLTGLGAWLGRKKVLEVKNETAILTGLLILALTGPVVLLLASYLRSLLFPPGSLAGISGILGFTLLLLTPFCVLSGCLFTLISSRIAEFWGEDTATKVYAWESAGSVLGALLANFVLVFILPPFSGLMSIILLTTMITGYVSYRRKLTASLWLIILTTTACSVMMWLLRPEQLANKWKYPGQHIEYYRNTPFGSLVVTSTEGQLNFYSNQSLLFSSGNIIQNEESVHYAMLQRTGSKAVLLVEGGISGSLEQILKYPVDQVDYVEMNPWIISLGEEYCKELKNQRVRTIRGDIRQHLGSTETKYDIVLLLVPEPSTILANRFYTLEFFRLLQSRMKPGAVISLGMVPTPNYLGEESWKLQSVLLTTLKQVFPVIALVPGEKNYYLASDQALDIRLAGKAAASGIMTEYTNEYYLDDQIIGERSKKIMMELNPKDEVNRDFEPVAFFGQINYWLSQYPRVEKFLLPLFILLLLTWTIRSKPLNTAMMVTGFSSSSLLMILLLSFQVIFGNLYLMIGAFILVFMAGLYLGAIYTRNRNGLDHSGKLPLLQLIMSLAGLLVVGYIIVLRLIPVATHLAYAGFLLLGLLVAVLAGIQYGYSAGIGKKEAGHVAGSLYGSDLLGSAAGTLLVTIIFIPLLGIQYAALILVAMNAFTAGWLMLKRNKLLQ